MTGEGNWPDPARPGVPMNPEVDGWHWVKFAGIIQQPWTWRTSSEGWWLADGTVVSPEHISSSFIYLGPCLLPAQHAAAVTAAREAVQREIEAEFGHLLASQSVSGPYLLRRALEALERAIPTQRAEGV